MSPEVMAAILPRVYPQMLDEVHAHQDAGRATFIVSAAGNGVVEPLATVLGMDGGIGTRYEVDDDGAFTGRFDGPFVYGAGQGRGDARRSPPSTTSTSPPPTPTPTRSPTCRCCERSATRSPSTRTRRWPRSPSAEGWRTMRFERLGRRLVAVAVTLLATVAGFGGSGSPPAAGPPPRRFAARR